MVAWKWIVVVASCVVSAVLGAVIWILELWA